MIVQKDYILLIRLICANQQEFYFRRWTRKKILFIESNEPNSHIEQTNIRIINICFYFIYLLTGHMHGQNQENRGNELLMQTTNKNQFSFILFVQIFCQGMCQFLLLDFVFFPSMQSSPNERFSMLFTDIRHRFRFA